MELPIRLTEVRKHRRILLACVFLTLSSVATSSHATLILNPGVVGGSGDVQNVLYNQQPSDQTGTTVSGNLNQSGQQVDFTSNEDLEIEGGGQARIVAVDGGFDFISIMLSDVNIGFDKIQFNIDAATNGAATITLIDQFNTSFIFTAQSLDQGENFFTGQGIDGQVIVKATISTNVQMISINDLQQVRIGPKVIPTESVPEPGVLVMLGLGLGMMGFANRRKRLAA